MSLFVILLGGELVATPRLMAQIAGARAIAADSGIVHAAALGMTPELWLGDFDSADEALFARYENVPRRTYPEDKAMTDGELAIAAALESGAGAFIFAGAFGGPRTDHGFLNMSAAISVAETGLPVMLTSGRQEGVPLVHGSNSFDYPAGTLFSVLPFTDLQGLTIRGAKWPLVEENVPFGSSLTMSNIVTGALEIHLDAGRALLLAHPDPASQF